MSGRLGPSVSGIHSCRVRPYDILVKRVLEMALCLQIVKPAAIRFVFREEPFVGSIDEELEFPISGYATFTDCEFLTEILGRSAPGFHDHVLRNQSCGRMWMIALSGPRLWTVISMLTSLGLIRPYSTKTSK
jgi:hypothetical protein